MLIKWAFCKLHDPESDPLFLCTADCNKIYHTNALILRQYFRLTIYNVPIDVDMNFDPNPILWTLENTLIPIRGHQTVPLL